METLPTLSIMERILFLRRVPLFTDLQPAELKQVAAVASEVLFADQQVLANRDSFTGEKDRGFFTITYRTNRFHLHPCFPFFHQSIVIASPVSRS